jgi:hypothetical protein
MRWAKSYSIIDHEILHGGYLHRLSHESMVLYLFLVIVSDRDGRSFYGDRTIMEILRLSAKELNGARLQLIEEGLVAYGRPYWWVRNIGPREKTQGAKRKEVDRYPQGADEVGAFSSKGVDRVLAEKGIKAIIEQVLGRVQQNR